MLRPAALALALSMTACAAFAADDALIARGHDVFQRTCAPCHGPINSKVQLPGTSALEARYKGALPAMLEQRTDLTPELIKYFVRHGVTVMTAFRKTEVTDADLDAIAAYLTRNNAK